MGRANGQKCPSQRNRQPAIPNPVPRALLFHNTSRTSYLRPREQDRVCLPDVCGRVITECNAWALGPESATRRRITSKPDGCLRQLSLACMSKAMRTELVVCCMPVERERMYAEEIVHAECMSSVMDDAYRTASQLVWSVNIPQSI